MTPTTTEKVTATVTAFGRIQPSRYSNDQVQSVLFERWDRHDESRKVWKTYPVAEARQFHRNQNVLLVPARRGNRQTWDVEWLDVATSQSQPPYPKRSEYQEPEPQREPTTRSRRVSSAGARCMEFVKYLQGERIIYGLLDE